MARGWGIQPSEFWAMSVQEWWLEIEMKLDESDAINDMRSKSSGKATRAEFAAARERLKAKQAKQNGPT